LDRKRLMTLLGGGAAVAVVAGALYFTLGGGGKTRLEAAYKHLEGGRLQEAAREFDGAVSARPAEAYEGLALVALRQHDPGPAQAAYQKAQQADPGSAEALANMGALLRKQGKYAEAAQLLDKAAALNPSDAMVQTLLKDARDADGTSQDAEKQKRVDALVEEL